MFFYHSLMIQIFYFWSVYNGLLFRAFLSVFHVRDPIHGQGAVMSGKIRDPRPLAALLSCRQPFHKE